MTSLLPHLIGIIITCVILSATVSSLPANYDSPARINDIVDLEPKHARRAMNDVKATITEVQKILESNPNLPRLTRGEIEELFETVTREEFEKSMRQGDHTRAKHMRALMVVLPYNTNDMSEDRLQELYTRPPITKVVSDDSKLVRPQQIVVPSDHSKGNKATTYKPALITKKITDPAPTTFHPKSNSAIIAEIISTRLPPIPSSTVSPPAPEKPSTSPYTVIRPAQPNVPPPMRPKVKDLLATIGLTAEVMPTPITQPPPQELTQEMRDLLSSFGLLTNEAPPKTFQFPTGLEVQEEFEPIPPYNFKLDDTFNVDELAPVQTGSDESTTQHYRMNTAPELSADDYYAFKPLPIPEEEVITSDMENFLKSYGLLDQTYRNKKSMFELPHTIPSTTLQPQRLVTMDDIPEVRVDFLPPDMMSVLGSLGISTGGHFARRSEDNVNYIPQATRRSDDVGSSANLQQTNLPTIQATRRSDDVICDLADVGSSANPQEANLPTIKATRRSDYVTSDMEDVHVFTLKELAQPQQTTPEVKETPTVSTPVFRPSAVPEKVFVVGSTTATKTNSPVSVVLPTPQINNLMDQAVNAKHLPSESVVGKVHPMDETAADFAKLQDLLETIRRLERLNRTLTNDDLDAIDLDNFQLSPTLLGQTKGPNPVTESEFDFAKNEVKRQSGEDKSETPLRITLSLGATTEDGIAEQVFTTSTTTTSTTTKAPFIVMASSAPLDSIGSASGDSLFSSPSTTVKDSSSTTSTTSTTSTSTTSTTTTPKPTLLTNEERKNGLEDSFPGGLDPVDEEPLPPPRRNGFYFFSDWNSFLEVGEDPDKVVVRFDPKVGDSSRFIKVEIPSKSFR